MIEIRRLCGLAAMLALAGPATATEAPANVAQDGAFSIMQFATTEPDKVFADWARPTPGVQLRRDLTMRRNQPIVTLIAFFGCAADPQGACNVTVEFETIGPAGKVYARESGKVWTRRAPSARVVELSEGGLGLRIEDKDPVGPYIVKAVVTDHVAGKTLRTSQVLMATP